MMSLMVPVIRKSVTGAAALGAGAAVCGEEHAAATTSALPAAHIHEYALEFIRCPTRTHHARVRQNDGIKERESERRNCRMAGFQDCRIGSVQILQSCHS